MVIDPLQEMIGNAAVGERIDNAPPLTEFIHQQRTKLFGCVSRARECNLFEYGVCFTKAANHRAGYAVNPGNQRVGKSYVYWCEQVAQTNWARTVGGGASHLLRPQSTCPIIASLLEAKQQVAQLIGLIWLPTPKLREHDCRGNDFANEFRRLYGFLGTPRAPWGDP